LLGESFFLFLLSPTQGGGLFLLEAFLFATGLAISAHRLLPSSLAETILAIRKQAELLDVATTNHNVFKANKRNERSIAVPSPRRQILPQGNDWAGQFFRREKAVRAAGQNRQGSCPRHCSSDPTSQSTNQSSGALRVIPG
jgi:hypothetical protein